MQASAPASEVRSGTRATSTSHSSWDQVLPPSPAFGKAGDLHCGFFAVGMCDDLHAVTVRVVEIDAASAMVVVDPSWIVAERVGVERGADSAYAFEDRVELGLLDK